MNKPQQAELNLIQINMEEKLNEFHKKYGETLNSRTILNEFIINMNLEFNQLSENLNKEYNN